MDKVTGPMNEMLKKKHCKSWHIAQYCEFLLYIQECVLSKTYENYQATMVGVNALTSFCSAHFITENINVFPASLANEVWTFYG